LRARQREGEANGLQRGKTPGGLALRRGRVSSIKGKPQEMKKVYQQNEKEGRGDILTRTQVFKKSRKQEKTRTFGGGNKQRVWEGRQKKPETAKPSGNRFLPRGKTRSAKGMPLSIA